ncbi:DnaJ family domain-containing protein [Yersinia aldovae]|uniref:DnaJ family domain-containing protein n=1 Tax=Yersinia aldovae TaxID=29483 RepID=UPI001F410929|nr:DnaJ family domain-containing protein [Yersinia aldovae]
MGLINEQFEKHIISAQEKGELDNFPGYSQPSLFDDATCISADLRAGYRLLKNAGYFPHHKG